MWSPIAKRVTLAPIVSTVPAASQPSITGLSAVPALRLRTLVSMGLTEIASIFTSTSRGPGIGFGASKSNSERSSLIGRLSM